MTNASKKRNALLIGNSDGIGLGVTRELLGLGWRITGMSRSESPLSHRSYEHVVADVSGRDYTEKLRSALRTAGPFDLCVYFVGVGEELDLGHLDREVDIFNVNLMGMIKTVSEVIPVMYKSGAGHFVGLSSVADELLSAEAPSYHASKAGFSNYLEGLALALKPAGVSVSNVRFGFVDTKMAKGDRKPFMMSVERAVRHMKTVIEKKPIRYTAPPILIPLVRLRGWMYRLKT